ncbi:hypothetical protein BZG35_09735 [Brevundimonas sp. LM2]|uniref:FecR family protein n=1 Tax=Brevundimonas sp. LM2 TaxID=1938605 RepID=UPI000983A0E0|nr:FecR domain-containing protein [Brevundimonas sp. LM2]AQR61898.1 hypothetical protein BZG35_09735 [Brevundimonas sp. LM2]
MVARTTSQNVDDAAAAWVAREDRGALSTADQAALDAWLHADPRHPGAFLRARAISLRSEAASALGEDFDPTRFTSPGRPRLQQIGASRRELTAWGGGLAACVAVAAGVSLTLTAPTAHATVRGQMRLVPLPDGSTVLLNTASRITVRYSETRRLVRLVEGEADFTVLSDQSRPFVVQVGDRQVETADGGGFRLRKLGGAPIDLLVHQGVVQVGRAQTGRGTVLGSDTRITLAEAQSGAGDSSPRHVSPGVINRELAWRDGKIAFEGESLDQAASAFRRYSDVRIIIADPTLAREPVTGLFSANDPVGFGRAVADLFGAPVRVEPDRVVVGMPQAGA